MEKFRKVMPLVKVDEATHKIYGLATSEMPDKDSEICDYVTAKEEFGKWSKEFMESTSVAGQSVSLGCIRVQHDPMVVGGKTTRIDFKDDRKQVWIETEPVSDEIWKMLQGGFLTGFSISGSYLWKKKESDYTRYGASITEVSYVDSPCNPEAHFAYVKADGSTELRKFQAKGTAHMSAAAIPNPQSSSITITDEQLQTVAQKTADILAPKLQPPAPVAKTKSVDGEELPAANFAYVGNGDDSSTWLYPIEFTDAAKATFHILHAACFAKSSKKIPASALSKAQEAITAAAKKHNINVNDQADRIHKAIIFIGDKTIPAAVASMILKNSAARAKSGGYSDEALKTAAGNVLQTFKAAAPADFAKSMYDVHDLASVLQTMVFVQNCLHSEREYEGDSTTVPEDLAGVIKELANVFLALAGEEVAELVAAIRGPEGADKAMTTEQMQKAHSVATKIQAAKDAVTAHHKAHGSPSGGIHKDAHDEIHGHLDSAMGSMKAATDSGDLKKASGAAGHITKAHEAHKAYHEKVGKMHKSHDGTMSEHFAGIHKAIGTDEDIAGEVEGPGAGDGFKGLKPGDLAKTIQDAVAAAVAPLQKSMADLTTQNTELVEKVKKLENSPEPMAARSIDLPKGIVSISRESVGKVSIGGDVDDTLGELAIG